MTVERLIEFLERQYPQALVKIEVTGNNFITSWNPLDDRVLLDAYGVESHRRTGHVHILCDSPDE